MKKKLLSLVMAVAMILSLAAPAFATEYWNVKNNSEADKAKSEQQIKFEAKTFVPTIKLTIPDTSKNPMVLNPYKIEYTGNISATESATVNSAVTVHSANYTDQIICPIYAIKNQTNAKLNVKAKATTTVGGEMALATSHVDLRATTKQAFINLVVKKNSVTSADWATATYAHVNNAVMGKLDAYDTTNNSVITLAATNNDTNVATLKNAALELDGSKTNYMLFQFDGELARNTTKAWAANDKLTTTVTFTFTPVSVGDAKGSYTNAGIDGTPSGDITLTLPVATSAGAIDNSSATFAITPNPAGGGWTGSLNAAPGWSVESSDLTMTLAQQNGSTAGSLTITKAEQEKLPADGHAHDYSVVLGFKDKNGVPRTADITLTLTRAVPS